MFSKLPVPTLKWRDDNMRYMLVFFPFVGAVVGLVVWAWLWISGALGFGAILRAVVLTLLPVAVTGGIHLDGFCDTVDALASRAAPERKREILKDPHAGAFAVIGAAAYLLLYFGLSAELLVTAVTPLLLGLMFVLSRTLSGLAVLLFPKNTGTGLLSTFREASDKKACAAVLTVFFLVAAVALLLTDFYTGGAMLIAAILCSAYLYVMSRRQFGGMSGDLAGWFLQTNELLMLAAIILIQKVVIQ
jgi:adenosylcobinamide-GDP ribazoletransferase